MSHVFFHDENHDIKAEDPGGPNLSLAYPPYVVSYSYQGPSPYLVVPKSYNTFPVRTLLDSNCRTSQYR